METIDTGSAMRLERIHIACIGACGRFIYLARGGLGKGLQALFDLATGLEIGHSIDAIDSDMF